jgi:hypothetical protein
MQPRNHYQDYRTLLRHAGLPEDEVERIAKQAEEDDANMNEADTLDAHEANIAQEQIVEKHINMIARQVGVQLETSHAIYIDGDNVEVTLYEGSFPLSHILDFANKLASQGVGSDVKVSANSSNNVVLSFSRL